MSIQKEIHTALDEVQKKISQGKDLTQEDTETLMLTALIEEEG